MALNPFFLQGTSSEQRLVQDLINEQLKMFGVELTYIPRKFVNTQSVFQEVQSSKFDDNYSIEAYVNTYEGYSGAGDVLTKFGMSLRDEVTLTISKERFEDFIAPFMAGLDDGSGTGEIILSTRPREGDLVYFPLGQRLFEVKFVEHEDPFYQLGKNYVYQLKCELFEYEDEVIDTSIDAIDTQIEDTGYITSLQMVGTGRTATVSPAINVDNGYVREIYLNNDGYGYTSNPTIKFTAPTTGVTASAVGILTTKGSVTSVKEILMTGAGQGYTETPIITISGGGGTGAAATCRIESSEKGVIQFNVTDSGVGYNTVPNVYVYPSTVGAAATANIGIGSTGQIQSITITDSGEYYTTAPTVTIDPPPNRMAPVQSVYLSAVGSGYTDGDQFFAVSGGNGQMATIRAVVTGGSVSSVYSAPLFGGANYLMYDVLTLLGGNNDATVTINNVSNNYFEGGGQATAVATIGAGGTVTDITVLDGGFGYMGPPPFGGSLVTISNDGANKSVPGNCNGSFCNAVGIASIGITGSDRVIRSVYIKDPGEGFAQSGNLSPYVVVDAPDIISGVGTYIYNEVVQGMRSGIQARVKEWDVDTLVLKVSNVGIGTTNAQGFFPGEGIKGLDSGALFANVVFTREDTSDKYNDGDIFETEADSILDFTESNPFGTY